MNGQELNKKLAEWAGFKWHKYRQYVYGYLMHGGRWEDGHWDYLGKCWYDTPESDGISPRQLNNPPDFTQSLDACFKWLVPKLLSSDCYIQVNNGGDLGWVAEVWERAVIDRKTRHISDAETPSLALCLVIEKLIDGEK